MSYPDSKVFLIAFAVNSRTSLLSAKSQWYSEVHSAVPSAHIILVGTKADLRDKSGEDCVSVEEIQRAAAEINAVKYVECSALTRYNVSELFQTVIETCMNPPKQSDKKKRDKQKRDSVCTIN